MQKYKYWSVVRKADRAIHRIVIFPTVTERHKKQRHQGAVVQKSVSLTLGLPNLGLPKIERKFCSSFIFKLGNISSGILSGSILILVLEVLK